MEERICTAHSSRTGAPCKRRAIIGGTVCMSHGGRAPQVRAAANNRILQLVNPALRQLAILVEKAETDAVKLSAVKDILDRAGLGATQLSKVELTGKDGEQLFPPAAIEAYFKAQKDSDEDYETLA